MMEVVIPHYNNAGLLHRTLAALEVQDPPAAVCVVDNASSDDSVAMVSRDFPAVRIVRLSTNQGFGKACNRGVHSSQADHVVLLNNDAVPDPTFLAELDVACRAAPSTAMISPLLLRRDGRIDSFGIEVDSNFNASDYCHGLVPEAVRGARLGALGPTGGAAVFARSAFVEVGGFDEEIFAYLEDVDLAIRMRLVGSTWSGAHSAVAVHRHSGTLGGGSVQKNYLLARNKAYLLSKYRRLLRRPTLARAALTETIVVAGKCLRDQNGGALRGWCGGTMSAYQHTAVDGERGSLDQFFVEKSMRMGLARRVTVRQSRLTPDADGGFGRLSQQ